MTNRKDYWKHKRKFWMQKNDDSKLGKEKIELNKNLPTAWDIVREAKGYKTNPKQTVYKK